MRRRRRSARAGAVEAGLGRPGVALPARHRPAARRGQGQRTAPRPRRVARRGRRHPAHRRGRAPGVSGYLPEDADVRALAHAVHTLASGAAVLPAAWIHRTGATTPRAEARDAHGGAPLSLREREVLALLGEGLTNQQIGRRLGLSAGTVKSYISAVYAKCGVDNRVQAALFAHGIEVSAA
ncbi:DNA-binding response regulator [Streptomyces spectabilis]|uniref:DNA-binding response regulator n=1 Tax=Streptomyces spectabilis TaxID=68270 RepID=A0A5P2XAR6_STRST|nr:DNA-binding response regulator [Streptomyces spectabilis]